LELLANLKQGKTYFSIDAKRAVELYVEHRQKDMDAGLIVPGRLATIRAHLKNWLDFIGRDTKLQEMERTDCESYFHFRVKGAGRTAARQVTVQNDQSTINAMMDWLLKRGEARIDGFDFRLSGKIASSVSNDGAAKERSSSAIVGISEWKSARVIVAPCRSCYNLRMLEGA